MPSPTVNSSNVPKPVVRLARMTPATQKCSAIGCNSISNEFITCKICSMVFHIKCVNVKKAAITTMKENAGFVWFCPHCAANSISDTAASLVNCTKAVTDMVSKFVPLLSDAIARISPPPATQMVMDVDHQLSANTPLVLPSSSSVLPLHTPEPTRVQTTVSLVSSKKRPHNQVAGDDSTPNQPSKINKTVKPAKPTVNFGTNDTATGLTAVPRTRRRSSSTTNTGPSADLRHIYVSRLLPSTSEDDVLAFLLSNNDISDPSSIICRRLVPASKKVDELNFVSFKISTTEANFSILTNPDIWPTDVAVREFEHIQKRPSHFTRGRNQRQH